MRSTNYCGYQCVLCTPCGNVEDVLPNPEQSLRPGVHNILHIEQCALCAVRCAVCNVQSHCRSVQWKSVKLLPGITTVKQYVCEVVLLKPEQRLGRDHQSPVTQTARGRRLSFCPLAEARDCPTPSIPSLKSQIQICQTRCLGA